MKFWKRKSLVFVAFALLLVGCEQEQEVNGLSVFLTSNSVSNFASELWVEGNTFKGSFSQDYKSFFFFRKIAPGVEKYIPFVSEFVKGKWTDPEVLSYADTIHSYTYQLPVEGDNKLIFLSNLKTKKDTSEKPNYNFWEVEFADGKYGKPEELGCESVIYNYNSQPCIVNNGTLYFTSDLPDWSRTLSYKMEMINGKYAEPVLFEPVNRWRSNGDWNVYEFCVSPQEDFMVVCMQEQGQPSATYTFPGLKMGSWTDPQKLGGEVNTDKTENFPVITRDGQYLLFTRDFSAFKIVPISLLGK